MPRPALRRFQPGCAAHESPCSRASEKLGHGVARLCRHTNLEFRQGVLDASHVRTEDLIVVLRIHRNAVQGVASGVDHFHAFSNDVFQLGLNGIGQALHLVNGLLFLLQQAQRPSQAFPVAPYSAVCPGNGGAARPRDALAVQLRG
ncbi:hypothetical protein G6F31_018177 [Rhizopus arrhizus]|nr:hypothetical protein G6F31_018177 [Rhizopus arrhizus]